ncbi:MAG: Cystathionine gamma-synthase [Myxococcaceae bacterium]|nr:Cystathionine gamma-synthase [Myxococcaceae bacterium]
MSDEKSLETRAVHAGEPRRQAHDALTTPVALTSTYTFADTDALERHHRREVERDEYGRYGNPTVRAAERKLADLDGAEDSALFASGMAAITTALLAMLRGGHHVVLTRDCYRRTRQFVTAVLPRYGVESTVVEPGDPGAVARAIVPGKTRVVLSESPTNPYLRVVDLAAMRALKAAHPGVKFLIDSTFATPVNQRPLEHGVDLVIHSATKYLGGHNDLLAGAISGSAALVDAIRDFRGVMGGVLDPHAAYLLLRGMKTLGLRVARQNASGLALARALESDPRVERVFYPGLESHPDFAVASAQMSGFGGVVSFLVRGDGARTRRFIDACRLATIAPSLGGVETLIEQPALMSYYDLSGEERLAVGIPDNLVRLAVGIESAADILDDLAQALDAAFSDP